MKTLKKQIGPVLFVGGIIGINLILWYNRLQTAYLNSAVNSTMVLGSVLLMGFMIVFLLSTRMPWLVKLFGGLDNLYLWHRLLAMGTTALIFLHGATAIRNAVSNQTSILLLGGAGQAGELARNGFIFLIALALLSKFFKYEHFRLIHRLLVIPYFISLYHSFYSSWVNLLSFDTLSIWMIATSVIGLGASFYMIVLYQRTAFLHKGEIVEKIDLNETTFELKIRMKRKYHFKPGQFTFIKINAQGISASPHPFSISGHDGVHLYLTIKVLGDYTKTLKESLQAPAKIKLTHAYGDMTFKSKHHKQVWVAGGVGITPFLGYLRSVNEFKNDIHLYYSVNYATEAVHLDILNQLAKENDHFTFTLFEASKMGYLNAKALNLDDETNVFMCGPRPMVQSLKKQIREQHPNVPVDFEAFSFTGTLVEDILKAYKKMIRKLKLA